MSIQHPIIAITGSSGAGTTSVTHAFQNIFRRERLHAEIIRGDSFHRYDRAAMNVKMADEEAAGNEHFSHFGLDANLLGELETLFCEYGKSGRGKRRHYVHDEQEAASLGAPPGAFTEWEALPENTDLLFYEGLHGALQTKDIDIARHVDLRIGVVPIINLEWIQKIRRDKALRGYSTEAVMNTILRRMPDYINYICPQFSRTHVNFQRVPTVDTSNPLIANDIPTLDESFLVIRFDDPRGIDFPYLLSMLHDSFMSRPNTIVCPGGKMGLAMQIIFTPMILQLMDKKRRAR
jgi:phosphoribulokinase